MDARTKILETATRLFSTQGYDSTSLSQVARDASVSKALIFWHFETKESLFQEVVSRTIEPYALEVDLEGLSEPEQLKRLIDLYYEFVTRNLYSVRFFLSLFLRETARPDDHFARILDLHELYRRQLAEVIERGQHRGTVSPEVEPVTHAALITSALNGILVQGFVLPARCRRRTRSSRSSKPLWLTPSRCSERFRHPVNRRFR
jgi:AcrR family transcriptional regulator